MSIEYNPDFDAIFMAIDGSGLSQIAAAVAERFAKVTNLNVQGLSVIDTRKIKDGESIIKAEIDHDINPDVATDSRIVQISRGSSIRLARKTLLEI
jgi:hypothetical protein